MNNNRYERKFVINNLDLAQILVAIYRSKFYFKDIFKQNNIEISENVFDRAKLFYLVKKKN